MTFRAARSISWQAMPGRTSSNAACCAAGMSPGAVLASATAEGADLLGLADRGRIAVGLRADLVVVDGDPFDFVGYAGRISRVYKNGVLVRRDGRRVRS